MSLNIIPRLPYTPEGFLVHDGVSTVVESFERSISRDGFEIFFIMGAARRGKTHLSIKLFDVASKAGAYPKLFDGRELSQELQEIAPLGPVVLIDNVDHYLSGVQPGMSGPFVAMVERLRVAGIKLVLFSSKEITELPCDNHVQSRLIPGHGHEILPPGEPFLKPLTQLMAKQRGLKLSERKVSFLLKRLGRDPREIEDYLDRVNYLSSLFGREVKMPLLSDAL